MSAAHRGGVGWPRTWARSSWGFVAGVVTSADRVALPLRHRFRRVRGRGLARRARCAVVARATDLIEFARRHGYGHEELIAIIDRLAYAPAFESVALSPLENLAGDCRSGPRETERRSAERPEPDRRDGSLFVVGAGAIEPCAGVPRFVLPEAWCRQWLTPESGGEKEVGGCQDGNAIELFEPTAVDPQLDALRS